VIRPREIALGVFASACAMVIAATATAQDSPTTAQRLGLEGPLDNDTRVPTCKPAADELARGDAEWARGSDDPIHRTAAFEAWRRALVASATLDLVEDTVDDAARFVSVSSAVSRRVRARDRDAFATRFEASARIAFENAGADIDALERAAYEHPFTQAAARASLRR